MNHVVVTRANFADNSLFEKYFKVMKDMYLPSFANQTCKNFEIYIDAEEQHRELLEKELKNFNLKGIVFSPEKYGRMEIIQAIKSQNYNLQTRHDCDDWAASNYIETVQEIYLKNKEKHKDFLIQARPCKLDYNTGLTYKNICENFTQAEPSMFLTLCQEKCIKYIYQTQHLHFSRLVPIVFTIEQGLVKWVIHSNNILGKIHSIDTLE